MFITVYFYFMLSYFAVLKRYYTFYIVVRLKITKLIIHLAIERKVG